MLRILLGVAELKDNLRGDSGKHNQPPSRPRCRPEKFR